jgi:predicted component of type VI protein secretion system
MRPNATAHRTVFQNTEGGPAMVQMGSDELGRALVELLKAVAVDHPDAYPDASQVLKAHKQGDQKTMLESLRKIPEVLITSVGGPYLLEWMKVHWLKK